MGVRVPKEWEAVLRAKGMIAGAPPRPAPKRKRMEPLLVGPDGSEVFLVVPVETPNTSNKRHSHWSVASTLAKKQFETTLAAFLELPRETLAELAKGCVVKLTRLSAGKLDDDNLQVSLKHIRDACAVKLFGGTQGQHDDSPRVSWEYDQLKVPRGVFGVTVSIRRGPAPLSPPGISPVAKRH